MCGIVGYVGEKQASDILIDGLKKLEYRGYDSAGIAVMSNNGIQTVKSVGKIANLETTLKIEGKPNGNLGIGHTRWATHGVPNELNAHPHTSGKVTVVHNGIIENYAKLRAKLIADGEKFISDTDTEVIAHLINK